MSQLTHSFVSSLLRLEGSDLIWRVSRGGVRAGEKVKKINSDGYLSVRIAGNDITAHRVVWLLTHGQWPEGLVDHIDRNKLNNQPDNLRLASRSENSANKAAADGKRFKGVSFHRDAGKFQAQCRRKYLGLFETEEEAASAYDAEARRVYGEFAWLNFPVKEAA